MALKDVPWRVRPSNRSLAVVALICQEVFSGTRGHRAEVFLRLCSRRGTWCEAERFPPSRACPPSCHFWAVSPIGFHVGLPFIHTSLSGAY